MMLSLQVAKPVLSFLSHQLLLLNIRIQVRPLLRNNHMLEIIHTSLLQLFI